MRHVPPSLGLLVPQVPNYQCEGVYEPAQTGSSLYPPKPPPFWQLEIFCVDPHLKFNLPKGPEKAGQVMIFEQPTGFSSLMKAVQSTGSPSLSGQKGGVIEGHQYAVGERVTPWKYKDNALFMFGGRTTWTLGGKQKSGTVLILITGRAVSESTLKTFARSMRLYSR